MRAEPAFCMTDFTSAKSRLIRPGVVIRSVMPETPWSSTWSACLKASSIDDVAVGDRQQPVVGDHDEGVDLVAQLARCRPRPGWRDGGPRRRTVGSTTPMVSAPSERAMRATTGAPPVPVPPPSPAVTKTMSAPLSTSSISSAWSSAALRADVGVGAGTEAARELAADVELDVGVAHEQRLRVGVDGDELDALEADLDHAVDGVDAATADADDLDDRQVVLRCCHGSGPLLLWSVKSGDGRWSTPSVARRNPNRQAEGYSYVNLAFRQTLGTDGRDSRADTPTRRVSAKNFCRCDPRTSRGPRQGVVR